MIGLLEPLRQLSVLMREKCRLLSFLVFKKAQGGPGHFMNGRR